MKLQKLRFSENIFLSLLTEAERQNFVQLSILAMDPPVIIDKKKMKKLLKKQMKKLTRFQ